MSRSASTANVSPSRSRDSLGRFTPAIAHIMGALADFLLSRVRAASLANILVEWHRPSR